MTSSIKFNKFEYTHGKKRVDIMSTDWKNTRIQHIYKKLQGTEEIKTSDYLKERKLDYNEHTLYVHFYYATLNGTKYEIHTFYDDDGNKYQGNALYTSVFSFENVKNVTINDKFMEIMYKKSDKVEAIKTQTKTAGITVEISQLLSVKSKSKSSSSTSTSLPNTPPTSVPNTPITSVPNTPSTSIESGSILPLLHKNEIKNCYSRRDKIINLILLLQLL